MINIKHFKTEIILEDYIENFDKNKMVIEFVELQLYNSDEDKRVVIKGRRFNIIYLNISNYISFNLFILNDTDNLSEKIDYLLDEGYDIEDIILDIYYKGEYIEGYFFNDTIGEQVDLIKFIEDKNVFDITNNATLLLNSVNNDLEFMFMPINDFNYPVKRKMISKNSEILNGFEFEDNSNLIKINNKCLLDSFEQIDVFITSTNSVIAPKDLDNFNISISDLLNINFSNKNNDKMNKIISLDSFGTININYCSPFFKLLDIRTIGLGSLFKVDNRIYFEYKISFYKNSKNEILSIIKDI